VFIDTQPDPPTIALKDVSLLIATFDSPVTHWVTYGFAMRLG
jgi:hypothetical protein